MSVCGHHPRPGIAPGRLEGTRWGCGDVLESISTGGETALGTGPALLASRRQQIHPRPPRKEKLFGNKGSVWHRELGTSGTPRLLAKGAVPGGCQQVNKLNAHNWARMQRQPAHWPCTLQALAGVGQLLPKDHRYFTGQN